MENSGLLIVISGPSGAGKGTICKALLEKDPSIHVSVSATTRAPRMGEVHGENYYFLTMEEFKERLEQDQFLEYAKVYDNYYGTPKENVMEQLQRGKDVLLEIDTEGALKVKEKFPEGVFIFILPPRIEDLKRRIMNRGTESEEDIKKRLEAAKEEIQKIHEYNYGVINDDVERATLDVQSILSAEKLKTERNYQDLIEKYI
ncbi:guanylate kinase [Isachenkonia alkalipeptolytica]|uniref:Guanylate kinase n=1 Tax=Isachenkonia alkalipeptolytica TaxID=2565777 RepID=A0AA43XM42_9CLOT|nr:guanylate kinase [Isachenkonia alkalipeptolytica]NBG89137.1 guanylate kinase [Isachenkonia alkalipeptolytica]